MQIQSSMQSENPAAQDPCPARRNPDPALPNPVTVRFRPVSAPPGTHMPTHRLLELSAPAGTLGCAPDADLSLAASAAQPLGRIQAVVRMRDELCSIENLSAVGRVSIDGRPLGLRQSAYLHPGDTLHIGGHALVLEPAGAAAETAAAAAGSSLEDGMDGAAAIQAEVAKAAVQAETAEAEEARDIFDSLLAGPGVVPVGSPTPPAPDGGEGHILSDTRPTVLDDAAPLFGPPEHRDDISAVLDAADARQSNS